MVVLLIVAALIGITLVAIFIGWPRFREEGNDRRDNGAVKSFFNFKTTESEGE